jgi:RimJ/RimL family protein N-acetyltransferase
MIRGHKVKLRLVEEHELDNVIRLLNDLDLRGEFLRTTLLSPHRLRKEFAETGMSSEASERLLILGQDDKIIGIVHHFTTVPYSSAREIGFHVLDPNARGQGHATEAVKLLIDYLFTSSPVNRLEVRMDTRNVASEKIAIRCGFVKEGTLRQSMFVQGKYVDTYLYALLRNEWAARS